VTKVGKRLAVNKQTMHRFHVERLILRKLNKLKGKERYRLEILNRFSALENLDPEWILIELGKLLERISKFQSERV
jgi:hypothetical protein